MVEITKNQVRLMNLAPGCSLDALVKKAAVDKGRYEDLEGIGAEEVLADLRELLNQGVLRFDGKGILERKYGGAFNQHSQASNNIELALMKVQDELNALLFAASIHGFCPKVDIEHTLVCAPHPKG